jgi:alpha-galactosidase
LNLALVEVQDFIIKRLSNILTSAKISYVKWDHNRSMTETPSLSIAHAYILGLYQVLDTLTTRFPDVLFEGCHESNWPAVQFISEDASQVALFYFQIQPKVN